MGDLPDGLIGRADGTVSCWWPGDDVEYQAYHDHEWGQPVDTEVRLFEKVCLEGFQAGLSWLTILRKRENFRAAFAGFELEAVAAFTDADRARLMTDAGIVRNKAKIDATINNGPRVGINTIERILCEGAIEATDELVAVCVAATAPETDRAIKRSVRAIRKATEVPVLVGGAAVSGVKHAAELGADHYSRSMPDALIWLASLTE